MSFERFFAGLFLLAASCFGDITYTVNIDTSTQAGNPGSIYFQFAPGNNADPASVRISDFLIGAPGSLSGIPLTDGGVTGALDSPPLTIDNSSGLNDYLQGLTYGPHISFKVEFQLPPTLSGDSGSELDWALLASDGSPLLTVDASGNIGRIFYDEKGAFTSDTLGNDAIESIVTAVPEPASLLLLTTALGACLIRRRRT